MMLTHYLRVALRNFRRHKLYSLINICCLSIGLGVVMTILLYILHEHSYDGWHKNARRIFAVQTRESFGPMNFWTSWLGYTAGPAEIKADPAVESMVRTFNILDGADIQNVASPQTHFRENKNFLFADSNFFEFFSFRMLEGRAGDVLKKPYSVVLTGRAAKKYFGQSDPIGKSLMMDGKYSLQVTGIAADPPSNSTIVFDFLVSLSTMSRMENYQDYVSGTELQSGNFLTWLLLRRAADTFGVVRSLQRLSLLAEGKNTGQGTGRPYQSSHDFRLRVLTDTHLKSITNERLRYLGAFTLVAGLILLLALVNYMSLATARSAMRAKEVGVRKVIGAGRERIAGQFYIESALYTLISFVAGVVIFLWFRPYFCRLMQLPIDTGFLISPMVLGAFGGLLLLVILIAGSYPALVLSAFRPVVVLYGKLSRQRSAERVRKGFIVFQFSLSMALVVCSIVIGKQLYFFRHTDTGIDRENVVLLPFSNTMQHYTAYKHDVEALPGIRQTSTTFEKFYNGVFMELVHLPGQTAPKQLNYMVVDTSFISLMGLRWKEKPLPGSPWYDSSHLIINETAASAFHLDGRATGRQLKTEDRTVTVAGVLKDFNFFSLQYHIDPLSLHIAKELGNWRGAIVGCLYAKIGSHVNIPTLIEAIRKTYARYDPQTPFEYQFLDEAYDQIYKVEDQFAGLFDLFSVITIVIACLGLFALATFAAEQRLKEIGIRKVLGASVGSISALLSRDFLRPILLSVLIASPLAWWTMHRWLQDFAYRTPISWWIFPAAAAVLLMIAQLTVLFRTIRAARLNPTINLRNE